MLKTPVPIPPACAQRPTFKGIVVPYFAWIDERGIPDFKVMDMAHVREAITKKLCGICAKSLSRKVWFIGGNKSTTQGVFVDLPMHEACARYSAAVCPFLLGNKEHAFAKKGAYEAWQDHRITTDPNVEVGLPEYAAFTATRHYRVVDDHYFQVTGYAEVEVFWRNPNAGA